MQRHLISSLIAAAFAALMITLQTSGMAQSKYKFVRIADTTGFQGGIQPPVAVNDSGKVVFVGSRSPGVVGVFTGSGGPLTAVADTTRSTTFFGFPSINGPGQATFFANKGVRTGYFAGDDGATTLFESGGAVHGFIGNIFQPIRVFQYGPASKQPSWRLAGHRHRRWRTCNHNSRYVWAFPGRSTSTRMSIVPARSPFMAPAAMAAKVSSLGREAISPGLPTHSVPCSALCPLPQSMTGARSFSRLASRTWRAICLTVSS